MNSGKEYTRLFWEKVSVLFFAFWGWINFLHLDKINYFLFEEMFEDEHFMQIHPMDVFISSICTDVVCISSIGITVSFVVFSDINTLLIMSMYIPLTALALWIEKGAVIVLCRFLVSRYHREHNTQ